MRDYPPDRPDQGVCRQFGEYCPGNCAAGCHVPLVADIHFKPDAVEAAKWVEKIRINPGNFVDKKKFEVRGIPTPNTAKELDRLRERFTPLVLFCRRHGRAMRIGSNHGSCPTAF